MLTREQERKMDKEDRYNKIFGEEEHMATALMYHKLALEAARNCCLTGQDGVVDNYRRTLQQIGTARHLVGSAVASDIFTQTEAEEYDVRIYDTEMRLKAELENAMRQGCPCAK